VDFQARLSLKAFKVQGGGYTIVHKELLCWIPILTTSLQPRIRLLFFALEATFSYIF
jgi:hypothetical protein